MVFFSNFLKFWPLNKYKKIKTHRNTIDEQNYLSKELLSAIKEGDTIVLNKLTKDIPLSNCYETSFFKNDLLSISILQNSFESVKYFVNKGAYLENICDNKTPLMQAAKYGRLEMVKLLVENDADINRVSIKNKTALSYSIEYERPVVEAYLRSLNAKE